MSSSQIDSVAKRSRNIADEEIDANRCCVCFGLYSDDAGIERKWLMCSCTRWINEDCIDNGDVNMIIVFSVHYVESFFESFVLKVY